MTRSPHADHTRQDLDDILNISSFTSSVSFSQC